MYVGDLPDAFGVLLGLGTEELVFMGRNGGVFKGSLRGNEGATLSYPWQFLGMYAWGCETRRHGITTFYKIPPYKKIATCRRQ